MSANDNFQSLELDLTDSNVNIIMKPLGVDEFSQIFGFIGVRYDDKLEGLGHSVIKHLESGRNYVLFEDSVVLDSQIEYVRDKKSIYFYYTPSVNDPDNIFLRVKGASYSASYTETRKIGFKELPPFIKKFEIDFEPIPDKIQEVYKIERFKSKVLTPSLTPEVLIPPITPAETVPVLKKQEGVAANYRPKEKWVPLHGINVVKKPIDISKVTSPKITWKELKDYDLANLERDFSMADFERRVNRKHVRDALDSILSNRFYDPVIKTVDLGNGKHGVIDAQHRLVAFKIARDRYGLKRYNFILAVYDEESAARQIYMQVNLGKQLTPTDYSKAWDDGSIPFFNELRGTLLHYPSQRRSSFLEMLFAHSYAMNGNYFVRLKDAEKAVTEITPKEIDRMKMFLKAADEVWSPHRLNNPMYRGSIFRNVFRVFMENNADYEGLMKLMKRVKKDQRIIDLSLIKRKEYFTHVYELVRLHARR